MNYKIKDLCDVTSSRRIFAKEYKNSGIPFFRSQEVIQCSLKGNICPEIFISEERYLKLIESGAPVPQKGEILISAIGANRGYPWWIDMDKFYFKDGNVIWLRNFSKFCDSRYIAYYLSTEKSVNNLQKSSEHSAQGAITMDLIRDVELDLPPLNVQQHIVNTISFLLLKYL